MEIHYVPPRTINKRSNNGIGIPTAQSNIQPTAPFVLLIKLSFNAFTFSPNVQVEKHLLHDSVSKYKQVR